MPVELTLELPNTAFSSLRFKPDDFLREMRLAAAIKWYEVGKISQSKASEIAGMSRSAFINALSNYHVSPFQTTIAELTAELSDE